MDDEEALGEGKRTKEDLGRIDESLNNAQKDDISPVLVRIGPQYLHMCIYHIKFDEKRSSIRQLE